MTYQLGCGCVLHYYPGKTLPRPRVKFCPLHAAAEQLREACLQAIEYAESGQPQCGICSGELKDDDHDSKCPYGAARAALAAAETTGG